MPKLERKCKIIDNWTDHQYLPEKLLPCKVEPGHLIVVTIFHELSERTSKQKWYLCSKHYHEFLEDKGKGWGVYYHRTKKRAPVIDYERKDWIPTIV